MGRVRSETFQDITPGQNTGNRNTSGADDGFAEAPPRANKTLPQILGDFDTLASALDYAARGETGFRFFGPRGQVDSILSYPELRQRALVMGRKLLNAGLSRGERVGMVAETGPEFMVAFFACQYAGLVPCPMPYTMYIGGREAYVERVAGMLTAAQASAAIATEGLLGHIQEAAARASVDNVWAYGAFDDMLDAAVELKPFDKDDVAYIQYSSGSTSNPKGVLISQAAITANSRAILTAGLDVGPDDRAFSWLPLYHDMGLVGFCLAPLMGQVTIDYMATSSFARRPTLWLKLMSDNRCTVCYAPSFGYDLAARRINGDAVKLDLSRWRVAGIGGDMVRPDVLNLFSETLEVANYSPKAFLPCYGMAEATLGITFYDLDQPFKVDIVDRDECKFNRRAVPSDLDPIADADKVRSFVLCGSPLPGMEVKVCDETGTLLEDRQIGHVMTRGTSLMSGYYGNQEATDAIMIGKGWMDTGDMGYWLDGQLVITGRSKDLILHNGRNIWPQDIEWSAEQVEPLKSGDVAAFATEDDTGAQQIIVLVQCRLTDIDAIASLTREVSSIVHRTAGVDCQVVMVPPRSLPFTSSGKLSRAGAKMRFLDGEIVPLEMEARTPATAAG